jgi:hypothetical protein
MARLNGNASGTSALEKEEKTGMELRDEMTRTMAEALIRYLQRTDDDAGWMASKLRAVASALAALDRCDWS